MNKTGQVWSCYAGEAIRKNDPVLLKQNLQHFMVAYSAGGEADGVAESDANLGDVVDISLVRLARANYEQIDRWFLD